ncbi:MAG: hypothetical protein B6D37_06585 [Sphingobacteriales bacterium UTBCD1]|nr:MAG: hypothetical protein B6D37_06585 [Sphingobacteriales bacterium UTBCD1]
MDNIRAKFNFIRLCFPVSFLCLNSKVAFGKGSLIKTHPARQFIRFLLEFVTENLKFLLHFLSESG